jgi:hypothetical protein
VAPKELMRIFGREISESTPDFEQAYSANGTALITCERNLRQVIV